MAIAGLCRKCGQYVWLNDQWGCVNGHPWTEISNWYDPATGGAVTPYWLEAAAAPPPTSAVAVSEPAVSLPPEPLAPAPAAVAPVPAAQAPAPATGSRDALLVDITATLAQYPGYRVAYGTDTDIHIDNTVADSNWGIGKKKIEFEAILKAVEPERTVYYWEILKEKGAGLSFGGFEAESYGTSGMKRVGKKKEVVIGPGGVAMDAEWDYGATRHMIEDAAARHGWSVKVVLTKKGAQW